MTIRFTKAVVVAAATLLPLLAACGPAPKHLSPDFGNSVRFNKAAQIVNPEPPVMAEAYSQNGDVAGLAYERYRTGKVTKPQGGISDLGQGAKK